MEGLVDFAPGSTSKIVGLLATSWNVSTDGLTYTFTLRQGVKFHDGTDFNAAAVKYNIDRWIDLPSTLQGYASDTLGRLGGFGKACNITSVEAPDPGTVVIKLGHPQSDFLAILTFASTSIASQTALKAGGGDNTVTDISKMTEAQGGNGAMVGTGPFKFKQWVAGDQVAIVKNADYWGSKAHLDGVVFKPVSNSTQAFNGLTTGEYDFAQQVSPTNFAAIKADSTLQLIERGESCNFMAVQFDQQLATVSNPKIREAIAYAVNKDSYIQAFYGGLATAADNWMPLTTQYAKPLGLPTYDPAMAKQLISESGIQNPTLDFWYMTQVRPYVPDPKGLFEAIASDLEAVGFKVVPHTEQWSDYLNDAYAGKFPIYLLGGTCTYPGPDEYLTARFGYSNGQPNPQFGLKSDELNQTLIDVGQASGDAAAAALWSKAQDLLKANMPSVPLLNSRPPAAAHIYVRGFIAQGALNEPFGSVWLDK
jgi:ABC-type transport system substrate-binding protein